MGSATVEIDIARPPEAVWAIVRDFAGLGAWMPGIDSCVGDDEVRTLAMFGMEIVERLVKRDDDGRQLTYSIESGVPVTSHQATISVHPASDGSRVTWDVDVEPDEMVGLLKSSYEGALAALKSHAES